MFLGSLNYCKRLRVHRSKSWGYFVYDMYTHPKSILNEINTRTILGNITTSILGSETSVYENPFKSLEKYPVKGVEILLF